MGFGKKISTQKKNDTWHFASNLNPFVSHLFTIFNISLKLLLNPLSDKLSNK